MKDWMSNPQESKRRLRSLEALLLGTAKLPSEWLKAFNRQMTKDNFNPLDCYLYFTNNPEVADAMFRVIRKYMDQCDQVIVKDNQ